MGTNNYLVPFGMFKIFEFMTSLIAWALMTAGVLWKNPMLIHSGKENFLLGTGIVVWLFSVLWFVINMADIPKKMRCGSVQHILFAVIHFVLGIIVLSAGAWCIDAITGAINLQEMIVPGAAKRMNVLMNVDAYKAGGAFGIITGLLLIIDAILHIVLGKKLYAEDEPASAANTTSYGVA